MRHRFSTLTKAKSDVAAAVKEKYLNVAKDYSGLQKQYHNEVEQLHQGEATSMERDLSEVAEESRDLLVYLDDHAMALRLRQARQEREDWDQVLLEEAREQMSKLMPTLEKLWRALEVETPEVNQFLEYGTEKQVYNAPTLQLFEEYAEKLEARLPIMQVVTNREKLKRTFEQVRQKSADPSRLFTVDSSRLLKEERDLSNVCLQLLQHDTKLKELIPAYEQRFREMFMHNGQRYLEVIEEDSAELMTYLQDVASMEGIEHEQAAPRLRSKYTAGREGDIRKGVSGAKFSERLM
jgi:hypothetical protein